MKKNLNHIQMIFLVSRARSGSTLLQSILDAHPNICAPIESKFVLHLNTKYHSIVNWDNAIINAFIKDLFTNRKFRLFWNVTPNELEILFNNYHINTFSDACKVIYLSHHSLFPKEEIKLIVDKNPLHSMFIFNFIKLFPDAKFIHLIRDPRAATYSHRSTLMQKNIAQLSYEWKFINEGIENIKSKLPTSFFTIKYEDLVINSQNSFKKIFDFIKLPFSVELLNANTTIKKKYQSNTYLSKPHHRNITKPITSSQINVWKNNLAHHQIEIINITCEQLLLKYNYSYQKPLYLTKSKTMILYGKLRGDLKIWLINIMFKAPFWFRAYLYKIAGLFSK